MSSRLISSGISTRGGALLRGSRGAARFAARPAFSGLLPLLLTSP